MLRPLNGLFALVALCIAWLAVTARRGAATAVVYDPVPPGL